MRFDIAWSDLAFGIRSACLPHDREALQRQICQHWSAPHEMLPCLSVRSGFDLLWAALDLPRGSEVLMSALTIPDMVRIVEHHGLAAVPLDLDVDRMAPNLEVLSRAITPAARAIVVAHLFGTRVPMEPIVKLARQHGLLVIEDCAQAFVGRDYQGHPDADAAMFSFGPIKTATALGGAVLRVRDPRVLDRMRACQATYPVQDRGAYLRRLLKYFTLKAASSRPVCDGILSLCRAADLDHDHMINGATRGFAGPHFFERIQRQPSGPLLAVLERRLRTFDTRRIAERAARGDFLAGLLPGALQRPGGAVRGHTYWVFPILAQEPGRVIAALGKAGFDATQGGSLRVIAPPPDRPELDPRAARAAAAKTIFLPVCPQMPVRSLRRMARVLGQLHGPAIRQPSGAAAHVFSPRLPCDGAAMAFPQGAAQG